MTHQHPRRLLPCALLVLLALLLTPAPPAAALPRRALLNTPPAAPCNSCPTPAALARDPTPAGGPVSLATLRCNITAAPPGFNSAIAGWIHHYGSCDISDPASCYGTGVTVGSSFASKYCVRAYAPADGSPHTLTIQLGACPASTTPTTQPPLGTGPPSGATLPYGLGNVGVNAAVNCPKEEGGAGGPGAANPNTVCVYPRGLGLFPAARGGAIQGFGFCYCSYAQSMRWEFPEGDRDVCLGERVRIPPLVAMGTMPCVEHLCADAGLGYDVDLAFKPALPKGGAHGGAGGCREGEECEGAEMALAAEGAGGGGSGGRGMLVRDGEYFTVTGGVGKYSVKYRPKCEGLPWPQEALTGQVVTGCQSAVLVAPSYEGYELCGGQRLELRAPRVENVTCAGSNPNWELEVIERLPGLPARPDFIAGGDQQYMTTSAPAGTQYHLRYHLRSCVRVKYVDHNGQAWDGSVRVNASASCQA